MQKLKTKISVGALIGLSTLLGNAALVGAAAPIPPSPVTTVTGMVDVIDNIVRWVYIIFFIIAVLYIILSAFTYLTAGGDEEKVKKAKNQIIYAAVAIIVALLAVGFQTIIRTFLETGG
ncbi:MAG: hypothetical protein V3T98_01080 [Candidatus Paceibacterota bacterium]